MSVLNPTRLAGFHRPGLRGQLPKPEGGESSPRLPPRESASNSRHDIREPNDSRAADGCNELRRPSPGSSRRTGISEAKLRSYVPSAKVSVHNFARTLIPHMASSPRVLTPLDQAIGSKLKVEVGPHFHWQYVVQAFVIKRLFEDFETGFFGIDHSDGLSTCMTTFVADYGYLFEPGIVEALLTQDSSGVSFLGKFCYQKFKLITRDLTANHLPDWSTVAKVYPTCSIIGSHQLETVDNIQYLPAVSNEDASSNDGDGDAVESSSPGSTSSSTMSSIGAFTKLSEPSVASSVDKPSTNSIIEDNLKKYTWDQVLRMRNGATSKQLGKGGFGTVYLGELENGKEVAVKILDRLSQQDSAEFLNEVNLLDRVHHKNLMQLLGYCQGVEHVLIFEFAEEGSVHDHLYGVRQRLDWRQRPNIALESACGIEYLQNSCSRRIIHRDIKCENILLTKTVNAKVADFGSSRLFTDNDNKSETHITTRVIGTYGYLDPEYHSTGRLRVSSDVYSFGALLLVIITGRRLAPNSDLRC